MSKLYTADRFVTIGGTTAQYVTGTGSLVTFPAIPSGADYIQNQIASAQSANMWISGSAYVGATNLFSSGIIRQDISGTTFNQLWYSGSSVGTVNTDGLNISYNATSALTFGTGGTTERMRITGAGNVGIGTSSPTAKLHVEGNATPGNYAAYINNASGGGNVLKLYNHDWDVADYLLYATNGGGHSFVVDGNGKVGIGTTSPGAKLDVRGGATNTEGGDIYSSNRSFAWSQYINGSTGSYSLYNGSDRLVITTAGNVGIGTSSPAYKLHVAGEIYNNYRVQINDGTANLLIGHWDGTNTRIENSGGRDLFITSYSSAIKFGIDGSENMRIATNGNIGVGTSSPSYKLDIDGALRASSGILNSNSCFERVLGTPYFTHGVSDLAVNINLGNLSFWGYIEVEVTGAYSNQNTPGKLTKLFAVGTNPGNLIYANESRVSDAFGPVADNMAIGEFYWDGSQYAIRLSHIVSSGNNYTVKVKMFTYGNAAKNVFDAISIGSLYSYTALAKQYPYYNDRLGIGTTSPPSKLSVYPSNNDGIALTDSSNNIRGLFFINNTGGVYSTGLRTGNYWLDLDASGSGQNAIRMFTGTGGIGTGSERMRITSDGNVGIGTSSPGAKLQVNGDTYTLGTTYIFQSANSATGYLYFDHSGTQVWKQGIFNDNTSTFSIGNGGGFDRLFNITNAGNVGIGTTSPTFKLDVSGNSRVSSNLSVNTTYNGFPLNVSGTAYIISGQIYVNDTYGLVSASAAATGFYPHSTDGLLFKIVGSEKMRITTSGNVGIGTSSPGSKLNVDSNTNGADGIVSRNLNTGGSAYAFVGAFNNANNGVDLRSYPNTNAVYPSTSFVASSSGQTGGLIISQAGANPITFFVNGGERMRIASSGLIGIGNSSPSYPLHVSPQVSNVSIYADYDIVAYSDQSVKENIRPIENALERVIESRGVLYDRIDSGEKDNIGFIAQELEVAFPELVVTNPDGTKAVKYQNAVAVLFEAVKEQQKQIDEIKRILNGLTN